MSPRMFFTYPFAAHAAEDFTDTLIPLSQAASPEKEAKEPQVSSAPKDLEKGSRTDDSASQSSDRASSAASERTIETLRAEIEETLTEGESDSAYEKKSKIVNMAIEEIGLGRYQWMLFVLCGFGWFADNIWLQSVALTLPSLTKEFGVDENTVRYTALSLFLGLCIGASFWGAMSDILGRRSAFNCTLFLASVFGLAAGFAPSWVGACGLFACIGLGVGGNLPIDGALFLEFLPGAHGNLLTLLSIWWPMGQLFASLIAWRFIPSFPVDQGWRYLILTMGAITTAMFLARAFLLHIFESPKFLLSRGRQTEAVAVIYGMAYMNGKKTWLTEDILNAIGGHPSEVIDEKLSLVQVLKRNLGKFSGECIGPLFKDKRTAFNTVLIWFIWLTVGMGYPLFNAFLPQYLARSGGGAADGGENPNTYRDYAITSIIGVPGSILAFFAVASRYFGRRITMVLATLASGIFVMLFTVATTPNFQLAMSCLEAFSQNIMYGVLYAYTPEVFPAPNRGTATGIASTLNRLAGLCAPIVAVNAGSANPQAPIYAAAALFFAAGLAMLGLIETNNRQVL